MVAVAQLVRAPDCGSGGRGFKSLRSPQKQVTNIKLQVTSQVTSNEVGAPTFTCNLVLVTCLMPS